MSTFQPPPPLLPDLISSPSCLIPSSSDNASSIARCYQHEQQVLTEDSCTQLENIKISTSSSSPSHQPIMMDYSSLSTPLPTNVPPLTNDCKLGASMMKGNLFNSTTSWPSTATPPSPASTTFSDFPPPSYSSCQTIPTIGQPPQLPDIVPSKVVEEFEKIMSNENDKVVLTNSVCLLFRFSIDGVRGAEVCQSMSTSSDIMNRLYYVLLNDQFNGHDLLLCYATGNLTNISKFEKGREAILGCNDSHFIEHYNDSSLPSQGVQSLIRSLGSRDSNVVIFAITAIHNLLLDRRVELQEIAKRQVKDGLAHIVQLLDNQSLINNYEFKVIVLDCLQILAYGNEKNRVAIRNSSGPYLILRTIRENFDNQPTEELIETASRVLKSLSACPENKIDIIFHGGINILTHCIGRNNHEILKTCLWTLRNLSDVINKSLKDDLCKNQLVERLLHILDEYAEEPCIVTCALGILANLTCNNETIKQYICISQPVYGYHYTGVDLLLQTIANALRDGRDYHVVDKEIIEPAVYALCHLMNQRDNPKLAERVKMSIEEHFHMFETIMSPTRMIGDELAKAIEKLFNLTHYRHCNS